MHKPKAPSKKLQFSTAKTLETQPPKRPAPRAKLPKRSKIALFFIGLFALLTIAAAGILGSYAVFQYRYNAVPDGEQRSVVVDVPRGTGLSSMAERLENDGLITSAFIFKFVHKIEGREAGLKAGEFEIKLPASMKSVYEQLANGKPIQYGFTVPEGRTTAQIIAKLNAAQKLTGQITDSPPEGRLLPETYLYMRGDSRQSVVDQMRIAQDKTIDALWDNRAPDLPFTTKREAIILASIVEKETGLDGERARVAAVFVNRLRRGMRLESDPTIIYGISKGEILLGRDGRQRGLRRSEIDLKTDWNTYQIDGLPLTPIANPGKAAIAAVLNPPVSNDLFFVADGTGGHAFAGTYDEHVRNVAQWRKIERDRALGGP
ncbi:endolytic transglycosylase MltG [Robiginitomaculum antarcticum]|uniref:endolytic transglycosylase MltG n=1 Tax=Robiginitomaculum antarcticum TaxID=437507 RepID=UPI00036EF425|nr:endolytic transglycosylase MltG [Robiginitomaculum antarcticum]